MRATIRLPDARRLPDFLFVPSRRYSFAAFMGQHTARKYDLQFFRRCCQGTWIAPPRHFGAAMNHVKKSLVLALTVTVGILAGCSGNSSTNTSTTTPTLLSDTLSGTVPPPVAGVRQAASVVFNVAAPGGSVAITLTSAVESRPDGTSNPNVVMGVAVGTPSGSTCTLAAGNVPILLQSGANSSITGTAAAGLYCVQVSDQTNQLGTVAFTVVVQHP
jgi:hypothetical protein